MKEQPTELITLPSGIRLAHLKSNSPVSHLAFYFKGGSRSEPAEKAGLAHYLEHCIFKGTQRHSPMWILSRLDEVGGELNAFTAKEEICVHATFLTKYTRRSFELMADLVVNSTFPVEEIEKEKEVIIDEINSYKDSPVDRIMDEFDALLYPGNTLGNAILGTKKSVRSLKREDLMDFMKSNFTADNLVISYVGKESKQKLTQLAEDLLSGLPAKATNLHFSAPKTLTPFALRKKESNHQSHAMLGAFGPSFRDEDRMIMNLLINYLGGPAMNARLNLIIREKYGLAYHVEANYTALEDTGYWGILLSAEQKNMDQSIELARKELERLCTKGLSVHELRKLKVQFLGQLSIASESNNARCMANGKTLLVYDRIDTLADTFRKINGIELDAINNVAEKYFSEGTLSWLIYDKK
ncbi:MAG: insulinase family protein [Flavobacteriia bacterium]|nr:insulinase family protein [Flavobacteriia bacterium]